MITAAKLKTRTVKDLAAMARKKKVPGWHAMRKEELVKALVRQARTEARKAATRSRSTSKGKATNNSRGGSAGGGSSRKGRSHKRPRSAYAERRLREIRAKLSESRDLAIKSVTEGNGNTKDRLVVMVRDSYWLHVYWELTRGSVDRARVAMGQRWHESQPVLRLSELSRSGVSSTARKIIRDIRIHGGVSNWYVDVKDPPKTYQIDIGYLSPCGKFFSLARSNVVSTPRANSSESFDKNWAEVAKDFDRIYAMSGGYQDHQVSGDLKDVFEERLRRPMGDPMSTRFGLGANAGGDQERELRFEVDAELIVHGVTEPDAHVTLRGEPVHLRSDGTFAVRFNLPDRRHVLPVVASSADGVEQRTIVLAVDRNTKVMEPVIRDPGE